MLIASFVLIFIPMVNGMSELLGDSGMDGAQGFVIH
jgi:hypothetical protein